VTLAPAAGETLGTDCHAQPQRGPTMSSPWSLPDLYPPGPEDIHKYHWGLSHSGFWFIVSTTIKNEHNMAYATGWIVSIQTHVLKASSPTPQSRTWFGNRWLQT
jgi:hypothetical protein